MFAEQICYQLGSHRLTVFSVSVPEEEANRKYLKETNLLVSFPGVGGEGVIVHVHSSFFSSFMITDVGSGVVF